MFRMMLIFFKISNIKSYFCFFYSFKTLMFFEIIFNRYFMNLIFMMVITVNFY